MCVSEHLFVDAHVETKRHLCVHSCIPLHIFSLILGLKEPRALHLDSVSELAANPSPHVSILALGLQARVWSECWPRARRASTSTTGTSQASEGS